MARSVLGAALIVCALIALGQDGSPEDLFQQALKLHRAGDYPGAVAAYEAFLRVRPDAVEAISNLGAVYSRMGSYGKAVEQYQRAIALDPANPAVRFNLGLAWYDSGQFAPAAREFEGLLKTQPGNVRAAVLLADCRFRDADYKGVIELLSRFESAAGDNRALLYLLGTALIREKQLERGQTLVDRILGQGDSAEAHMMLGIMRAMTLDASGAVTEYDKALKLNPKLPGLNSAAGVAYLNLGDQSRAVAAFRGEIEHNPNDFDAQLMLGVLLRKEEKHDEALPHLRRALEIRPGAPDASYQMALIELAKNDLAPAQARLEELTKRYPNFVEAHISLATVYYRLKRREDGDREGEIVRKLSAEQQAQTVADVNSAARAGDSGPSSATVAESKPVADSFEAVAERAAAARDRERIDEAVELYRRAVRLRPSWAEGWWYLGTLHYDRDRFREARDAFAQLVSLKPKGGPGLAMLGLAEFGLKEYERAHAHIAEARAYGLGDNQELTRVARYHAAILQTRFGQPDAALRILQFLARDGSQTESLLEALGLAALRLPMLPAEIPAAKRDLVRLAGRAQALLGNRDRAEAAKLFEELAAKYPAEPGVHYAYGVFLLGEDADGALREFELELKLSPKDVPTRLQIAFERLRRAEYRAGLPHAEEAVRLAPESFAARNVLGRLLLGDDQVARAVGELEIGVKLAPDSPETRFALAQAYERAGRKQDAARERAEFKRLEEVRRKRTSTVPGAGDDTSGSIEPRPSANGRRAEPVR